MSAPVYSNFPLNPSTVVANGQQYSVMNTYAFAPSNAAGPSYRGGPRPPQTIPTGAGASLGQSAASAMAPTTSSALLLCGAALVVGLLGLRYIHWR